MTPYYEQDGISIYHGDCRDVLPALEQADAVVTDPPYNVGLVYGDSVNDVRADYAAWCASWFQQCRAMAPVVALSPGIANVAMWCAIESPFWILGWFKPASSGRTPHGFNNWEPVMVWGRSPVRGVTDAFTVGSPGWPPVPDLKGHPCPKPIRWGRELVRRMVIEQGLVIDPFMGSGTVLVAAKHLGRRAIGIEIEERYCEIAAKRLAQGVLFGSEAA